MNRGQALAQEIIAGGGRAQVLPLNLSSLASVRACVAQFRALNLPLHILINNAGTVLDHGFVPWWRLG
jgi:NAD(P)-dependent dehydrogenase (short-subunit alcohol dehydrogenase family)